MMDDAANSDPCMTIGSVGQRVGKYCGVCSEGPKIQSRGDDLEGRKVPSVLVTADRHLFLPHDLRHMRV